MKILIDNYVFNKTNKTVTFTDYTNISLKSILLITNVTNNTIIYNFASIGGTVLNNVLTLTYNTSLMNDSDILQIFYEDDNLPANVINQNTLIDLVETLHELSSRLSILAGMANAGAPALRVVPISSVSTAVTGSVTVASTSITNFGTNYPAKEMSNDINNFTAILANINNVTIT